VRNRNLSEALAYAMQNGCDVQRNHTGAIGITEVVVAGWDWEIVDRARYTTGNASAQACFIMHAVKRIRAEMDRTFTGEICIINNRHYFISEGQVFYWNRDSGEWMASRVDVKTIDMHAFKKFRATVKRRNMRLPSVML
jgi:hypothetical protein